MWTASADKTVRRWNTEVCDHISLKGLYHSFYSIQTGKVDTVLEHPDRVKSVAIVGPYVVTGASDDNIRVWDIAVGHTNDVQSNRGFNSFAGCFIIVWKACFNYPGSF